MIRLAGWIHVVVQTVRTLLGLTRIADGWPRQRKKEEEGESLVYWWTTTIASIDATEPVMEQVDFALLPECFIFGLCEETVGAMLHCGVGSICDTSKQGTSLKSLDCPNG